MLVSDSGLFQLYESGIFDDPTCPKNTDNSNDCFDVNHGELKVELEICHFKLNR